MRRLSDLTGNLLTLARAEEVPADGSFAEVDFSALAAQTEQMFREPLELKGCALDSRLTPGLRVRGNQAQLATLCSILLDNAAKYAPDGSSVLLSLGVLDFAAISGCCAAPAFKGRIFFSAGKMTKKKLSLYSNRK